MSRSHANVPQFDSEEVRVQLKRVLDLVETQLRRLKQQLGHKQDIDAPIEKELITATEKLTKAAIDLSKESRAWAKTHEAVGKKLTLQQKIDLTVAFIEKLSPADRTELLGRVGALNVG